MSDPENKSLLDKITDLFFERDLRTVIIDTLHDVIVPAIKDTFVNAVNNAANLLVSGGRSVYRPDDIRRSGREPGSRYHNGGRHERGPVRLSSPKDDPESVGGRMSKNMDRLWVESKNKADDIVEQIVDHFNEYDVLTVSQVLEFADIRSDMDNYTQNNWGWLDIDPDNVRIVFVPDNRPSYKWEIQLPKPHRVD